MTQANARYDLVLFSLQCIIDYSIYTMIFAFVEIWIQSRLIWARLERNRRKRANLTLRTPTFRIITNCVVTGLRYKF